MADPPADLAELVARWLEPHLPVGATIVADSEGTLWFGGYGAEMGQGFGQIAFQQGAELRDSVDSAFSALLNGLNDWAAEMLTVPWPPVPGRPGALATARVEISDDGVVTGGWAFEGAWVRQLPPLALPETLARRFRT